MATDPTPAGKKTRGSDEAAADPHQALESRVEKQFRKRIYPLLADEQKGCVECHANDGTSQLVLSGDARDDFRLLLDQQYLRPQGADTLLNRLTTDHADRRMPKDSSPWSAEEISRLKGFLKSVKRLEDKQGVAADEQFPRSLIAPYRGEKNSSTDNQFLTYRQLKGKIQVLFEDDWMRNGRDRFAENVAMFGGADFKTRFDESNQPTASFLTALETLSREVASRAYDERVGPFKQWPSLPRKQEATTQVYENEYRAAIARLYEHILVRPATETEISQSMALLERVFSLEETIASRDDNLHFELTVTEPTTGLTSTQQIHIPVSGDRLEVCQFLIDQSSMATDTPEQSTPNPTSPEAPTSNSSPSTAAHKHRHLLIHQLGAPVWLEPNLAGQRLVLYNAGTKRNVSFAGVDVLDPATGEIKQSIPIDSSLVEVEGAWQLENDDGFKSFEDRNQHKGMSLIRIQLNVAQAGEYRLAVRSRLHERNANQVLVEFYGPRAGNALANPNLHPVPPVGQAQFAYDSSDDAAPFFAPPAKFLFDSNSYVRITNAQTLETVTAGAVEFIPWSGSTSTEPAEAFTIDSLEADGAKEWSRFDEGRFKAYNVKGTKLHDDNRRKGELELAYRLGNERTAWRPETWYELRMFYPGKRDQEPQVPATVFAAQSSPIIQVAHPRMAKADARIKIDASSSYTVSHSPLRFHWRQTAGSRVDIPDPNAAQLQFTVPRRSVEQAAWVALCAALMRHPDFIFTRPPSLFQCEQPKIKAKLQLVKIALDLVGRSPTSEELQAVDSGTPLTELIDRYLTSAEFRDFYFHRIRLYLESQGTELQDEPARLWCYVAFNRRPFQEILTADYTVDSNMQRVERPAYHGRTGVLTTRGFIQGKPGLPHYNYAAQVSMLFLGYVYEVPPDIVELREGITALGTTDPNSVCYSCHKILTPLAFQRTNWSDEGDFLAKGEDGLPIDASDRGASVDYPFPGNGLEAFATQAVRKERFLRTMINLHVSFYFGRPLRFREDERELYRKLWDRTQATGYQIPELIREIVNSPEYLEGRSAL